MGDHGKVSIAVLWKLPSDSTLTTQWPTLEISDMEHGILTIRGDFWNPNPRNVLAHLVHPVKDHPLLKTHSLEKKAWQNFIPSKHRCASYFG